MDQPIMALSDVDISPGFVTQLSVTPTLTVTTDEARNRFTPDERVCYFDDEFRFKYLPAELYRWENSTKNKGQTAPKSFAKIEQLVMRK